MEAAPRATGGHRRWRLAASLMGIVAGQSWIVSPEGDVLAETTAETPVATVTINLDDATSARQTYPRNLPSGMLG